MVAVTEQQQESQEESPKANSGATAIASENGVKQASADHGPDLLPNMEHFVWLVRKIKHKIYDRLASQGFQADLPASGKLPFGHHGVVHLLLQD